MLAVYTIAAAVYAVATADSLCRRHSASYFALNIILVAAIAFSIPLIVKGMKLLLRTTAIINVDLVQMVIAPLKSTDILIHQIYTLVTAILADKLH